MTGKADFTPDEWNVVLEGPPSAGLLVATSQRGGTFRETFAMTKAYSEARKEHGSSELLDEIVSSRPKIDHTRYHSPAELEEHCLQHVRDAVALLEGKADAGAVDEYRKFVLNLAEKVASAHREEGQDVSDAERGAIAKVAEALGTAGDSGSAA